MQLYHLHAKLSRGIDLLQSWIDEKTDADTCGLKAPNCGFKFFSLRYDIETSFGRNLLAFFWNETGLIWNDAQGNIDDLRRVAHFQVQLCHDICAQPLDITILNMATIAAQVGNYSASAGTLTD